MNALAVRPRLAGGKPTPHRAAVEEAWEEFQATRLRAMTSARIEDGIRCGRAWGAFLRLFERL
jgi:hypothetical protein